MKPRVRFAPSPTGYLHIGGARTFVQLAVCPPPGGTFVPAHRDTDAARNTQEAVDAILSGLRWLGLGGMKDRSPAMPPDRAKVIAGRIFQSQRKANYTARVEALLSRGGLRTRGAIKFKMARRPILIPDMVVGDVLRPLTDREEVDPDWVLVRSDGQPVFRFVNVVDDLEMGITHVIRGEDHLSNTAKHIALFRAFGVEPPKYGHIPLILNPEGSKMSKRDRSPPERLHGGGISARGREQLSVPAWLVAQDNTEKLSLTDVIERFDLPQILRHNAKFDFEKLTWLQGEYCRELAPDRFYELGVTRSPRRALAPNQFDTAYVKAALDTCRGKIKTFAELPAYAGFYFKDEFTYDPEAAKKAFVPENKPRVEKVRDAFGKLRRLMPRALKPH